MLGLNMQMWIHLIKYALICMIFTEQKSEHRIKPGSKWFYFVDILEIRGFTEEILDIFLSQYKSENTVINQEKKITMFLGIK